MVRNFFKPTLPDSIFSFLTEPLTHHFCFSNIVSFPFNIGVSGQDRKSEHGGGDGSGTSSCSRIFEGPQVNIDVTSAGASMALGLMYLKTNDISVADRLAVCGLLK